MLFCKFSFIVGTDGTWAPPHKQVYQRCVRSIELKDKKWNSAFAPSLKGVLIFSHFPFRELRGKSG